MSMMRWACAGIAISATLLPSGSGVAQNDRSFNAYILKAVAHIGEKRAAGGYDINRAFSQDLKYGDQVVKMTPLRAGNNPNPPHPTMCVAAVAEVIVEALRIYSEETGDKTPFTRLGAKSWNSGGLRSIKANMFMFAGTGSRGTAGTLQRFGMGKEVLFAELKPGDFVNLNRQKSGHAVIFLGYLDKNYSILPNFGPSVAGFKYFSAQGKGRPDAGFANRYAFFGPNCPAAVSGKPRDCGVIRSPNQRLLNTGTMYAPAHWKIEEAAANLGLAVRSAVKQKFPTRSATDIDMLTEAELDRELSPRTDDFFSGETID